MSVTNDPKSTNGSSRDLAAELEALEADEARIESRTRRLELSNPLTLLFSILAFGLALGALIVALSNNNSSSTNNNTAAVAGAARPASVGPGMPMTGRAGGMMMVGVGDHGRFTRAQIDAVNHGTVYVQLGDFWVAPTVTSVRSGRVTFVTKNVGRYVHELMIERAPVKMSRPGEPVESAAQGMIDDMQPGADGRMTLKLQPGRYVLFCNVSGHYAMGQHIEFTVGKA